MLSVIVLSIILISFAAIVIIPFISYSDRLDKSTINLADVYRYGGVIASGNGVMNPAIFIAWGIYLLSAIICVVCAILFAYNDHPNAESVAVAGGIISVFCLILVLVFVTRCIMKTKIVVHENGVTGVGVGPLFRFHIDFTLSRFHLEYDKITSVDATPRAVVIHASGAQYQCYVWNPDEIQRIIIGKLREREN